MECCVAIPLIFMIRDDFRSGKVYLMTLIVFAATVIALAIYESGLLAAIQNTALNCLLLGFMGICVTVLFFIIRRKLFNPVNVLIGSGDIIFLLTLTPVFTIERFLLFLTLSLTGTLLWAVTKKHIRRIPLIGTMGIAMIIYMILV